jgi:hypothetical protein
MDAHYRYPLSMHEAEFEAVFEKVAALFPTREIES